MTGSLKLHPLDILFRMSPLAAFQSLLMAWWKEELMHATIQFPSVDALFQGVGILLLVNASLAFLQNISSFHTNKVAGAVTISVCANVKQCLVVLLAISTFYTRVGMLSGIGMAVALSSSAWYSWIQLQERRKAVAEKLPQ